MGGGLGRGRGSGVRDFLEEGKGVEIFWVGG